MMKALCKTAPGPGFTYCDVPVPTAGPGQVLVEVKAAGICGSDVHMYEWSGSYDHTIPYMPFVAGHEYAGIITAVGDGVTARRVGERVVCRVFGECGVCHFCRTGRPYFCLNGDKRHGLARNGAFAPYCVMEENEVIPIPDTMSFEVATLIEPGIVTCSAVMDAQLEFGDFCVIFGPGPIGLMTMLFAKARGAGRCVVVGTRQDGLRLDLARKLGADCVLVGEDEDLTARILELTGGNGADRVFECSGDPAMIQKGLDLLTRAGKLVAVGIYPEEGSVNLTGLVRHAKSIIGTYSDGVLWEKLVDWMGSENLYARQMEQLITHRSTLTEADEAFGRSVRKENCKEVFLL